MDFKKLIFRFKQFGGIRLVIEYARLGVLGTVVNAGLQCIVKRQNFKQVYPDVLRKIEPLLIKRYEPLMRSGFEDVRSKSIEHQRSKIVWFCCTIGERSSTKRNGLSWQVR